MSSIFDVVDNASCARKKRVMQNSASRPIFQDACPNHHLQVAAAAGTLPPEMQASADARGLFGRHEDYASYPSQHARQDTVDVHMPSSTHYSRQSMEHGHETMQHLHHASLETPAHMHSQVEPSQRDHCRYGQRNVKTTKPNAPFVGPQTYLPNMPQQEHASERYSTPQSNSIYAAWLVCVICTLLPVFVAVVNVMRTPGFSSDMLRVPYQCNIFYLGLFVGLPGITVHIFILSLRFHKGFWYGVCLSVGAIGLLVISVEHACSNTASISVDQTFCVLTTGIFLAWPHSGFLSLPFYKTILENQWFREVLGLLLFWQLSLFCPSGSPP